MEAGRLNLAAIAALTLLLAAPGPTSAQDEAAREVPLYQVEIILFAHRTLDPDEEYFAPSRMPPQPTSRQVPQQREPFQYEELDLESLLREDRELRNGEAQPEPGEQRPAPELQSDPPPFGFRVLRSDELQLGGAYATLNRLPAYAPLLHAGWVQEGRPEGQARPFNLNDLGRFNPSGSIQLHVSRFLHLKVDVTYQAGGAEGSPGGSPFELSELALRPRYTLAEDRRIARTGELHYFDHPAFGLLVMIRPQQRQAPPQDDGVPRPAA